MARDGSTQGSLLAVPKVGEDSNLMPVSGGQTTSKKAVARLCFSQGYTF